MLIPYGTDAPLQRPPWGTCSLIVVNVVLFLMQDIVTPESWYVLNHGEGLHPIQWLLSAFAHADAWHLIGNMIFLFSFGIVVESMMKLRYFLALYLAIAVIQNMLEQVLMLGFGGGGSLGASSAIYGTMMVACICAPGKNIYWIWFYYYGRMTTFKVPVLLNGVYYFCVDFGIAMFSGFAMSTPFLHASGGLVGIVIGIVAYRLRWFQLDGEDLWSRFKEIFVPEKPARTTQSQNPTPFKPIKQLRFGRLDQQLFKLDSYLSDQRYNLARMKFSQFVQDHQAIQLSENQLIRLINLATEHEDWDFVLSSMKRYLESYGRHATAMKLNGARIQVVVFKSPSAATSMLKTVQPSSLSRAERTLFDQIKNRIRMMQVSNPAKHPTTSSAAL